MHQSEQERYDALRTMLEMPHRSIDVGFCPLPGAMIAAYERAAERRHRWELPSQPQQERSDFGVRTLLSGSGRAVGLFLRWSAHAMLASFAKLVSQRKIL